MECDKCKGTGQITPEDNIKRDYRKGMSAIIHKLQEIDAQEDSDHIEEVIGNLQRSVLVLKSENSELASAVSLQRETIEVLERQLHEKEEALASAREELQKYEH